MTLAKAIEAARESLTLVEDCFRLSKEGKPVPQQHLRDVCSGALAALPDKPMTEDEIFEVIMSSNEWNDGGCILPDNARKIIRALKAANVLYVEDK